MLSSALGALTLANSLSGGRLKGFVKKNVGKFAGKLGKWGIDKIAGEKTKKKIKELTERGANYVEQAMGEDSELSKNLKNFSKELKGEHVELRPWNDGEQKDENNILGLIEPQSFGPYSKNLGGTNYKRYFPKHMSKRVMKIPVSSHTHKMKFRNKT